ncbi:hypothetical protein M407DRAFT_33439 [Tulasnella calospora MUT 4182]|uniref:Uncharacterized protein n=1 Tax=Tulasnella calospora MUT 4182 TaxID=1051891 RepID=A0A0C3K6B6_9AGAM|nr:hypothetical protein M407DRAFT_33439 [Tulasnella calospora MUT 4182]
MAPGTSKTRDDSSVYTETEDFQRGGKAAYLVCGDDQRIYGNEFSAYLHAGRASTITVVLDTCGAAGFTEDFPRLCYIYDPEGISMLVSFTSDTRTMVAFDMAERNQIVVTASRVHEKAVSFRGCGALTFFLAKYLQEHPNDSAISFVKHLDDEFATQPKADWRQHPQIQSRYRLNGPFRLLSTKSGLEAWLHSMLT